MTGVLTSRILGRAILKRTDFVYMHEVSIAPSTFADNVHVRVGSVFTCTYADVCAR